MAEAQTSDATLIIPLSRRRWLKRLWLSLAVMCAVLVVMRWLWGVAAERALQSAIRQARADGLSMLPEDLVTEPVADAENTVTLLDKAGLNLVVTSVQRRLFRGTSKIAELTAEDWAEIAELVKKNDGVRHTLRAARARSSVYWPIGWATPISNTVIPMLHPQRSNVRFLVWAAMLDHRAGRDDAAFDTLMDARHVTRAVGEVPFMIGHAVAIGCESMTLSALEHMLPTLRVSAEEVGAVRPQALHTLIEVLLDDHTWNKSMVRAMQAECTSTIDTLQAYRSGRTGLMRAAGSIHDKLVRLVAGPCLTLDGIALIDHTRAFIEACQQPNWPAVAARLPDTSRVAGRPLWSATGWNLIASFQPSYSRMLSYHFTLQVRRHMVAAAIAIRLYEIDHGRRPADLQALTPKYLAAVPIDFFSDAAARILYRPSNEPAVLYSVWENGKDDGARVGRWDRAGRYDWDLVLHLNGPPQQTD